MDRCEIYGADPLSVGEVERLVTGLALDDTEKTADRLKALALLHDWGVERADYGDAGRPEGLEIKLVRLDG